jgi:hypothetical protein
MTPASSVRRLRAALALVAVAALALVACDALPGKPRYADRELLPTEVMARSARSTRRTARAVTAPTGGSGHPAR